MKRNYPFILILMFFGLMAYITLLDVFAHITIIMLVASSLSIAQCILSRKLIKISIGVSKEHLEKGEKGILTLKLRNRAHIPSSYIYIYLRQGNRILWEGPQKLCIVLGPREDKVIELSYKGKLCGKEDIGIEELVITDYFYLVKGRLQIVGEENNLSKMMVLDSKKERHLSDKQLIAIKKLRKEVTIIPKLIPLREVDRIEKRRGEKLSYGENISSELETYKEGESQKLIHWKMVASKDIYLMRQRENRYLSKEKVLLIFDPVSKVQEEQSIEQFIRNQDKAITVLASMLGTLLQEGKEAYICFYKDKEWHLHYFKDEEDLKARIQIISDYEFVQDLDEAQRIPVGLLEKEGLGTVPLQLIISHAVDRELELAVKKAYAYEFEILDTNQDQRRSKVKDHLWYITDNFEVRLSGKR